MDHPDNRLERIVRAVATGMSAAENTFAMSPEDFAMAVASRALCLLNVTNEIDRSGVLPDKGRRYSW